MKLDRAAEPVQTTVQVLRVGKGASASNVQEVLSRVYGTGTTSTGHRSDTKASVPPSNARPHQSIQPSRLGTIHRATAGRRRSKGSGMPRKHRLHVRLESQPYVADFKAVRIQTSCRRDKPRNCSEKPSIVRPWPACPYNEPATEVERPGGLTLPRSGQSARATRGSCAFLRSLHGSVSRRTIA